MAANKENAAYWRKVNAEFALLSLANEKRKFAVDVAYVFPPEQQFALERGIDEQWFTLVDVSFIATTEARGRLMRVFRLTDAGIGHLAGLKTAIKDRPA